MVSRMMWDELQVFLHVSEQGPCSGLAHPSFCVGLYSALQRHRSREEIADTDL